jgi:hypothetical protein
VLLCVDAGELTEREQRAAVVGDRGELEPVHVGDPERLGDGERPVPELRLRGEQLDLDALLGVAPDREQRLQSRYSAACDQHPQGAARPDSLVHRLQCPTARPPLHRRKRSVHLRTYCGSRLSPR